jgi:hypothetical protein
MLWVFHLASSILTAAKADSFRPEATLQSILLYLESKADADARWKTHSIVKYSGDYFERIVTEDTAGLKRILPTDRGDDGDQRQSGTTVTSPTLK